MRITMISDLTKTIEPLQLVQIWSQPMEMIVFGIFCPFRTYLDPFTWFPNNPIFSEFVQNQTILSKRSENSLILHSKVRI